MTVAVRRLFSSKLSFRMFYGFDLNEDTDVYDYFCYINVLLSS